MKIEETWNILEAESAEVTSGYLNRRILPESRRDLYLAIEKPSGARMLMMYVDRSSIEKTMVFPSSSGFEVRRVVFPGDDRITLQLVLANRRYKDIFTTLVQDITENIAFVPVEADAVRAMATRLRRWQLFLEKHDPEGLSEEIQHGLYGELWFLRQVVLPHFGLSRICYWLGPEGAAQDFSFEGCAVEVKTTVTQNPQKLSISNENQLNETTLNALFLLHLSLDVRTGGETLPEMVESLRVMLGDALFSRELFEKRLFQAGYLDIHASKYGETVYRHRTSSYFKVEQGFPRIVPIDLKQGVTQLRYAIELIACRPFAIAESKVIETISAALTQEQGDNHG
jgi:Putative  PD-(D/E)XK family member, (DUF4420)